MSVEEGGTAEVEAVAADVEEADTAPAGPHDDDTIRDACSPCGI